jgi:prepilin-type N-terminal cleavage/methylation domain-containing protein
MYDLRLPTADCRLGKRPQTRFNGMWMNDNQKSKSEKRKFSRGLTLIEVMLATVILGIGSGVLLLATARCLALITKSRHYSSAQRLIQQVGAEHPLTRSAELQTGSESGRFDEEENYRWEREITESENENRKGLYTVRTRVSWSDRGRDSFEEVTTWHYIQPEETN